MFCCLSSKIRSGSVVLVFILLFTQIIVADAVNSENFDLDEDIVIPPEVMNSNDKSEEKNFIFSLSGNIRNRSVYNQLNSSSLMNPDNEFSISTAENLTEGYFNFGSEFFHFIEIKCKGRLGYEIYKNDLRSDDESYSELDQIYISLRKEMKSALFIFSSGKQRFKLGTGNLWNPVDTLNSPLDPEETDNPQQGKNLYRGDVTIGKFSATLLYVPVYESNEKSINHFFDSEDNPLTLFKLYGFVGDTDLSFYLSKKKDEKTRYGLSFSTVENDLQIFGEVNYYNGESEKSYITKNSERTQLYDPVGDTNYTLPSTWGTENRYGDFYRFLIGFQYTFSGDTTLIGEYYYNKDGYDKEDMELYRDFYEYCNGSYQDDLNSLSAAQQNNNLLVFPDYPSRYQMLASGNSLYSFSNFRNNYIHFSIKRKYILNSYDAGLDIIICLDDFFDGSGGSAFLRPTVSYIAKQNWCFTLYSQIYAGNRKTEYGMLDKNFNIFFEIKMYL